MFQGGGHSLGVAVGYAYVARDSLEKRMVCDAEQKVRQLDAAIGITVALFQEAYLTGS